INGAIALWWTPVKPLTTGIQYRYAYKKLGEDFLQDGIVYSIKYNF
ncbi:outer membrane protein OmpK, partial [Yersinia pestis]